MTWVAVDMDGVICDFVGAIKTGLEAEFGPQPFTYNDVVEWNYAPLTKPECLKGGTIWPWLKANPDVWANAAPIRGALEALEELSADFYIELLTSKPDWAKPIVWEWCVRHNPAADRVTIVGHNPSRQMKSKKKDFSDAAILVDDSFDNAVNWVESGRPCILFDAPWNQNPIDDFPGIYRVRGWKRVVTALTTKMSLR